MHSRTLVVLLLLSVAASAQRVDALRNSHYRLRVIDKLITDAKGVTRPAHSQGTMGFVVLATHPNRKLVLVEYVGKNYGDFEVLRRDAATDGQIKVFEKAHSGRGEVEAAARAAGFAQVDLDKSLVGVR